MIKFACAAFVPQLINYRRRDPAKAVIVRLRQGRITLKTKLWKNLMIY